MPLFAVEFHPLAADEAEAAERWYRERNETAAARFQRELDRVVELIGEGPDAAPPYIDNNRRFFLRRFPFFVVVAFSISLFM
jgi:plasmid stabilization system protein ParE